MTPPTRTARLLALSILLGFGACAPAGSPGERAGVVDVPTPASVDLATLTGRLEPVPDRNGVLLHFWATW